MTVSTVEILLLVLLVSTAASFVQRVSGFGYGIFAMLFLPYLLGAQTVAASVSGMVSCAGTLYNAIRYRKNIRLKLMLPLVCAALVTIPIAVYFSASAPERVLKPLLGAVLILLSLYFLFFSKRVKIQPTLPNGILAGALGGTLTGLFSTGGPPVVLYLINATDDNLTYFATIQTYFALTNIYSTSVRALNGLITGEVLLYFAVGLLGMLIGNAVGAKVFSRLNAERLKLVIYLGMIVSGILMLLP